MGILVLLFVGMSQDVFAQIDSRNQKQPDNQEATSSKKKKKVKKSKKSRLSKKDKISRRAKKREQGKKIYSNKRQLRNSRKSFRKGGDQPYKGSITGRRVVKDRRTPRKTYARPQPDPYASRRFRTERDRAGPRPPKIRTATKRGEVARTGDIAGRKRIRQRSVSTAPRPSYPQPNPYVGRKRRTERDRAYSNKRQRQNIRTVSKPSEVRKPRTTKRISTATVQHKIIRKRNVYAGHEQRKGEKGTRKDIAGKKLRTRNYRSERPSRGNKAMLNPRPQTEPFGSGDRFSAKKYKAGKVRSTAIGGEKRGGGKPVQGQRNMKGFSSAKAKSVVQPKPIRTYGNRKKGNGEAAIFGGYGSPKIRTSSRKSEDKPGKRKSPPPSISSASVFGYKKAHPYRGKDKRFSGENSSRKDIAGRTLRTRNFHSRRPDYRSIGSGAYVSIPPSPPRKNANPNKAKSVSGKRFNNRGNTLTRKIPGQNVGSFSGNLKAQKRIQGGGSIFRHWNNNGNPLNKKGRGAGTIAATSFSGRSRMKQFGDSGVGTYSGNIKYQKPLKGGGSISRRWNNNGQPLFKKDRGAGTIAATSYTGRSRMKQFGDSGVGTYSGNIKYQKPLKGGGSISGRWNNNGQPLIKKNRGAGTIAATSYTGRMRPKQFGDSGVGSYSGNIKYQKQLNGGGSISRSWNNNGQPLIRKNRGSGTIAATTYTGRMRPKQFGDTGVGSYSGNIKYQKQLKGGGSISRSWNNNGQPLIRKNRGVGTIAATTYTGRMRPKYFGDTGVGKYTGNIKSQKPLKGGGSISRSWNNNGQPLIKKERGEGTMVATTFQGKMKAKGKKEKGYPTQDFIGNVRVVSKKTPKAQGTEYGLTRKVAGIKMGEYGGKMQAKTKPNREDINVLTARMKARKASPSEGTELGKTHKFAFLSIGDPNRSGLVYQQKRLKVKSDLPDMLSRDQRRRPEQSPGTERGKDWALTFWEFGNPYKMGLAKKHTVAKTKNHPSTTYAQSNKSSKEEKEKLLSVKLIWAKLFKKNAATAEPEDKKKHRPRYDKGERIIWETEDREDWYKK